MDTDEKPMSQEDITDYFKRNRPDLNFIEQPILADKVANLIGAKSEKAVTAKYAVYVSNKIFTDQAKKILQKHYGNEVYVGSTFDGTKFNVFFFDTYSILFKDYWSLVRNNGTKNCKVVATSPDYSCLSDIQTPSTWVQCKMLFNVFEELNGENKKLLNDVLELSKD